MTSRINESKTLTKHVSYKCNVNLMVENEIQIKSGTTTIVDVSANIQENIM